MEGLISFEVKDHIAHVVLSRPSKHNALDLAMLEASFGIFRRIKKDKSVRAVIISGAGPSFCSGLDFPSVTSHPWHAIRHFMKTPWRRTNNFQRFAWQWRSLHVPVLAAIHGSCFGGGLQLALAADMRFASADATFSMMEAKWGLVPDMTGTLTLRHLLREDHAKDLVFSGRVIDATEAERIGLVTKLCADPLQEANAYAQRLLQLSPDSIALSKKLLQRNRYSSERKALRRERFYELCAFLTPNQRIALRAGLKKAKATYQNRMW